MRIAVISDIHGNIEAFTTALKDIELQAVDKIISLGDNVGYGADPEAVIQQMIASRILSVLGNHDLACVNKKVYNWYIGDVKRSLDNTLSKLSLSSFDYLKGLKVNLSWYQAFFVHGFWPDSVRRYLHQIPDVELLHAFKHIKESTCFLGHTHRLSLVYPEDGDIQVKPLNPGMVQLEKDNKYMINVGSVGQPRDGDPGAKYVIWDTEKHSLNIRYVVYDNQTAARKIVAAGLPLKHALAVDQGMKL
ncbi:MAG: metallophosphoesterase family protein [Desulfamplus sp.]|nr:metallophosphoesterase family protein [Desulfamplus sp.]